MFLKWEPAIKLNDNQFSYKDQDTKPVLGSSQDANCVGKRHVETLSEKLYSTK